MKAGDDSLKEALKPPGRGGRRAPRAQPHTDASIHAAIARAILHGELKAGAKLPEHRLAEIFGASRERIRKVLHRLAAERRLEIIPNRGVRVPQPTIEEVKRVYEAHRVLEAGVIVQLVSMLDARILGILDAHLAQERLAAERGDRAESVRLSGAFHLHLVDALGNPELSRFLRDLLSRSSVMVSVYEPASQSICAVDEHGAIVEALRARDATRAIQLSHHHFLHVEQRLHMEPKNETAADLKEIFRGAARGAK
nr:GntR family transcriptional regulator [Methylocapsa sp. S129]